MSTEKELYAQLKNVNNEIIRKKREFRDHKDFLKKIEEIYPLLSKGEQILIQLESIEN